ncbi:hypothetical protein GQ53DRAFT_605071, partial [Thozetella sp. PMI_491]
YRVCSKSLSRASKVWKAMLYGRFAERQPADITQAWVVALPDDDPAALTIFLNIIHGSFEIPQALELQELLNLTILSNKYDLAHLLRPWVVGWMENMAQYEGRPGCEPLLWIAWEVGDRQLFTSTVKYITLNAAINSDTRSLLNHN